MDCYANKTVRLTGQNNIAEIRPQSRHRPVATCQPKLSIYMGVFRLKRFISAFPRETLTMVCACSECLYTHRDTHNKRKEKRILFLKYFFFLNKCKIATLKAERTVI